MKRASKLNEVAEILLEGNLSFKYFAENIVKEIEGKELKIPKFQEEWFEASMKYQNVVISASRRHGKSVIMSVLIPLYIAAYNSNKTILIISPTEERAFENLQKIRYVIENNTYLKPLQPTNGTGSWTKTKLDTSNHCQFYCRCMSPNLRGFGADYLLLDEAGEIKDIETFLSAVMPITFPNGKCIAIGTPTSNFDLLERLRKNVQFHSLTYPAIDKEGKLLWPEKFTLTDLKNEKRLVGPVRFEREFLLNIMSKENRAYSIEMLMSSLKEDMDFLEQGDATKNYFFGVDLAYSPKGDYTVFVVFEQLEDGGFALVHLDRMRGIAPDIQENRLADLAVKFKPKRIVIDKSLFGQTMVNNLRNIGLPVEAFDFSPGKRGMILYTLQRLFSDKKLYIPYNEKVKSKVKIVLDELAHIDIVDGKYKSLSRNDDCAISLGLAAYAASKFKSCLAYGVSNSSNIYKGVNNYGGERSYIEQVERNLELFSKYKK